MYFIGHWSVIVGLILIHLFLPLISDFSALFHVSDQMKKDEFLDGDEKDVNITALIEAFTFTSFSQMMDKI